MEVNGSKSEKGQASLETMVAVGIVLSLVSVVAVVFLSQGREVGLFREEYGAEQVCFTISDLLVSLDENGTSVVLDVPRRLNGPYTIEFLDKDLHVNTERGFFCTIPRLVHNSTNGTRFEVSPGKLVFTNYAGLIYLGGPEIIDNTPPVITNVHNSPTDPDSDDNVLVIWDTSELANSSVIYRVDGGGWSSVSSSSFVESHSLGLGTFSEGSLVEYYVTSCDDSGNCATDDNGGGYYSFIVSSAGLTDYGAWQSYFDSASDYSHQSWGWWTVKVWLLDQNQTEWAGQDLRLNMRNLDTGTTIVNNQLMSDNGDGSYQYSTFIWWWWIGDWIEVRVDYDDSDDDLDMSYYRVVYASSGEGLPNRPWKLELDSVSNVTSVQVGNNYIVKAWLYNAREDPMSGESTRITVHSENGSTLVNNQVMTDNGDGSYEYSLSGGTLSSGVDYRIQISTVKNIGPRTYTVQYEYIVEGVA